MCCDFIDVNMYASITSFRAQLERPKKLHKYYNYSPLLDEVMTFWKNIV